jgi:hypothetical protein
MFGKSIRLGKKLPVIILIPRMFRFDGISEIMCYKTRQLIQSCKLTEENKYFWILRAVWWFLPRSVAQEAIIVSFRQSVLNLLPFFRR